MQNYRPENVWQLVQDLAIAAALGDDSRLDQAEARIQGRIPDFSDEDRANIKIIIDDARSEDSDRDESYQRFERARDDLLCRMTGEPSEALAAAEPVLSA